MPLVSMYKRDVSRSKSIKYEIFTKNRYSKIKFIKFWVNCPKKFSKNSIFYYIYTLLKICILAFLFLFLFEISGNLDACTKQIENRAEKLKLEILIYLCIDFIYMYDWYIISTRILLRTQKCIIHGCMLSVQ